MPIIHAVDLQNWAATNVARDNLGELLRKLIHEHISLSNIKNIRFLAHEANTLAGWDGVLECESGIPWIPSGTSVWELGTGNNQRQKIRDDFNKRLNKELPSGWIQNKTTYVAVTLGKLDDHVELVNELKQNSPWLNVRIIDAATLEEWIAVSLYVETWLQEKGIGPSPKIQTLRRAWKEWSETTQPPVSEALVLAGRNQSAVDLINSLTDLEGPLHIQADSSEEAVAFIYSVVQSAEDELFRDNFLSRTLVIGQEEDVARFLSQSTPLNIILKPPATSKSLSLSGYGHKVINAFGNSTLSQKINIRLKRALRSEFREALVKMQMQSDDAEIEARACGCSPSIWRVWNLLKYGDPGKNIPDWARKECSDIVVPAVLLGGWSEKSEGDKKIIKTISGMDFEQFRDKLHFFITCNNPLLEKVGDTWIVSAPATAFALIVEFITEGNLISLFDLAKNIFEEIDPYIDIPPDDRPFAGLHNVNMQHSKWLRDGIVESLLRIAAIGQQLERNGVVPKGLTCQDYVDSIIRALPTLQQDYRLLASLRDQLPVLMEAAPAPFLEALESLLQGQPEKITPIFAEGEGLFAHSLHPGLLWGLETLAWEPRYLGRVALLLAGLAEIDPGGKISNRPINSLREIFLAWHPGTNANLDQRLQALDLILDHKKEIGWKLLNLLMPKSYEVSSNSHEPMWREFGRSSRNNLTRKIVWDTYQAYVDRAIIHAGCDYNRWKTLIDIYENVSDKHQKMIEEGLLNLAKTDFSKSEKKVIWEALRNFINKHRAFPDAAWSLPTAKLERLEGINKHFESNDPLDQAIWLFNSHFPDIPFPKQDIGKVKLELEKLRFDAVNNLWTKGQFEAVKQLLNQVTYPGFVAPIITDIIVDKNKLSEIITETINGSDSEQFFARCLSGYAYEKFGNEWTQLLISQKSKAGWSSKEIVNILLNYPDSIKTFTLIDSLGKEVKDCYWEKKPYWANSEDSETFSLIIDELAQHGRAIDAITTAANKWSAKEPNTYLILLDQALQELNKKKKGEHLEDITLYEIEELFSWLKNQDKVDKAELAKREYSFLPLLTGVKRKDLALHEFLATDPIFFNQVICDAYRPNSGYPEDYEPSQEEKQRAQFAWKLLNSWKRSPGVDVKNIVNADQLNAWIEKARNLAIENDRIDIADQEIGKALYHIPPDPNDGLWPHVALRNLIESLQREHIEIGIEVEQANSRGVYTKAMFEGGKQEKELAKIWWDNAEKMRICWPRTRAMFERIAESWESRARFEDERAEKDKLRFR